MLRCPTGTRLPSPSAPGAVIFNALSGSRIKDTNFTWEGALSFDGNTGPYVQYTYARASSVLRKAACLTKARLPGYVPSADETALVKTLLRFPARVDAALNEYEPSIGLALCSGCLARPIMCFTTIARS